MELLQAIGEWPVSAALRRSSTAYLLVNAAHIFSIGVLIGSITALDLRLIGLFRAAPLETFGPPLARVAAGGLVLATLTGFLLFSVRPVAYAGNPAFLCKLALIGLGAVNALVLHLGWFRHLARGNRAVSPAVRLTAAVSLFVWASTVVAGRWIGFL